MAKEFIIYADESVGKGKYYSNFFGGALVTSTDLARVVSELNRVKQTQQLNQEIKWVKVTPNYLEKYKALMDAFFDLVKNGKVKVRIMFTANRHVPQELTDHHRENKYYYLYYQFLKHAFGLQYASHKGKPIPCRFYLDALPHTREKSTQFRGHLKGLETCAALRGHVTVDLDQIAEIVSHEHVILQCLDVVLGSMSFRLNDKHKIKPKGKYFRGKRTVAKEGLYKHINQNIRQIYPYFNIGITTGGGNGPSRWNHPYRHWQFVPKNYRYDERYEKP